MVDVLSEVVFITVQVLLFYYYIFHISLRNHIIGTLTMILHHQFQNQPSLEFSSTLLQTKAIQKKNPFMVSNHLQTP